MGNRYAVAGMGAALNAPDLTDEEARELAIRAKRGDSEARDELVLRHLRLVEQVANRLAEQWNRSSDELFSEACLVFLEGLNDFDPERAKSFSFVTWAGWYIAFKLGEAHFKHGNPRAILVLYSEGPDPLDLTLGDLNTLGALVNDFDLVVNRALRGKWITETQASYLREYLTGKSITRLAQIFTGSRAHIGRRLRAALEVVQEIARNER